MLRNLRKWNVVPLQHERQTLAVAGFDQLNGFESGASVDQRRPSFSDRVDPVAQLVGNGGQVVLIQIGMVAMRHRSAHDVRLAGERQRELTRRKRQLERSAFRLYGGGAASR